MTTILSEGDARYSIGDQVNIVIVLIDANGTSRVRCFATYKLKR